MPKGTPRTATAASVILQQAATPEQEQVEYIIRQADTPEQGKRNDLTSSDMTDKVHTSYGKPAYTPATTARFSMTGPNPRATPSAKSVS